MSNRNMIKTAEKATKQFTKNKYLSCYDLSIDDLCELFVISKKDAMDADSVESVTDSTQAPREGGYEGL